MDRAHGVRHIGDVSVRPADAQVRFWNLLARATQPTALAHPKIGPFLTVSRQAGSGGAEVARRVGLQLGWAVYDRELVESLARRLELEPSMLDLIDETRSTWFKDTLLNLLNSRLIFQDSYVSMVGEVMLLAAIEGRSVFVGRAGHLLLPSEPGLRVRVIAPRDMRLARFCTMESIDPDEGAARLERLDRSRADFIHRHFHHQPDDPSLYDMVVDAGSFGIDGAVKLVIRALEIRGLTESS